MQCQGSRVKMMVDALPKRLQGITIKIESNLKVTDIIKRTIDMRLELTPYYRPTDMFNSPLVSP
jgi:hypothetical protein